MRYAKQDIYLYRHCNKGAPQLSNWYTDNILSPIDARRELALPTANTAQRIVKVKIPQGTPYIEGRVASQTNNPSGLFGAHATGGGKQFYFLDEHKNVIEVIEDNVNLK